MGFLRFLLALIVVVHHITHIPGNKSFPPLIHYLDAMVAVLVFYIFSGFYMSLVINRKYCKAPNFPVSFYANRALRIFPLYWLVLVATYTYYVTGKHADIVANINAQPGLLWIAQVFMNITTLGLDFIPSLGGYTLHLIGPAWSLGAEWLFYLLAPWLVRWSWRRTAVVTAIIFAVRLYLFHLGQDRYPMRMLFFPLSLGFFLLGHLSFLLMEHLERLGWLARIAKRSTPGFIGAAAIMVAGWVLNIGRSTDPEILPLWAFYALVTLAIPFLFSSLQRSRVDKFVGDLTFPLYISHALVLSVVADYVAGENLQRWIAIGISMTLAVVLTILIETPLERTRAVFGKWLMQPHPLRTTIEARYSCSRGAVGAAGNSFGGWVLGFLVGRAGEPHTSALPLGRYGRVAIVAILLLPMLVGLLYVTHTNHLPESDGAGYLIFGFRAYDGFRTGGIGGGLHALYSIRDWRPIAFDILLLPCYFLTGGRLYPAYSIAILLIFGYTVGYGYLLLKRFLSPLSAAIGADLIALLPLFLSLSINFYGEVAVPGLVLGSIYHLLESADLERRRHVIAAALLAGVVFCIRPDYGCMIFGPLMGVAIIGWCKRNVISGRDALICSLLPVLAILVLLARAMSSPGVLAALPTSGAAGLRFLAGAMQSLLRAMLAAMVLGIPAALWLDRRSGGRAWRALAFILILCAVPLLWFFPFSLQTFEWVYRSTFGDLAGGGPGVSGIWRDTGTLGGSSGAFLVLGSCGVAVLGYLCCRLPSKEDDSGKEQRRAAGWLITAAAAPLAVAILCDLLISPSAFSNDPIRLMAVFCCASIAMLALIGLRGGRYLAVRQGVALAIVATQALALGMRGIGMDEGLAGRRALVGDVEKPRFVTPEPNAAVLATLDQLDETEKVSRVEVEGYTDVSVGGIMLLVATHPTRYTVEAAYISTYAGLEDLQRIVRNDSHLVFSIRPALEGNPDKIRTAVHAMRAAPDAMQHRQADILEQAYFGDLKKYGMQLVRTARLGDSEVFYFRTLVDNLASVRNGARPIATSNQVGFPVSALNDGTPAPWGALEGTNDVYAGVVLPSATAVQQYRISVLAPNRQQHLRDISVVVADAEDAAGPHWTIVRSRLKGEPDFSEKITVPQMDDAAQAEIEIDRGDPHWGPHKYWGFACFSGSMGYARNYLKSGTGVYVRELEMR